MPSSRAIDLALHPLDQTRLSFPGDAQFDVDLSRRALLRIPEAALAQPASGTVLFMGLELQEAVVADPGLLGLQPHTVTRRTAATRHLPVDAEVLLGKASLLIASVSSPRLLVVLEAGVPTAKTSVCDIAVDAFVGEVGESLLIVVAGVRCDPAFPDGAPGALGGILEPGPNAFDHWPEQTVFLALAEGFGMKNHLVFAVDGGDTSVALDDAVRGLHLGALGVGDVALDLLATSSPARIGFRQKALDLPRGGAQLPDLLLLPFDHLGILLPPVVLTVPAEDSPHRTVDLAPLAVQLLMGAAPFLNGIGRELAAVHGEHLLTDQAQLITHENDLGEEVGDRLGRAGDEVSQGGEVGAGVGRQGPEGDVLPAQPLDAPAAGDAPRVGVDDDLEQQAGIVGRAPVVVVSEVGVEG